MARIVSHPNALTGLSLYGLQPKGWKEFDLATQVRVLEDFGNEVDTADGCTLYRMTSHGHTEYYLVVNRAFDPLVLLRIYRIPRTVGRKRSATLAFEWRLGAGENPPEEEDDDDPVTQAIKEHRVTAIAEGMSEEQWTIIQRRLYKLPEERLQPLYEG
jgi:hypothetical protein